MRIKEERMCGARVFISFFSLLLVLHTIHPFSSRAEDYYKFERMWPVIKQPWYFYIPESIAVDNSGAVYVADTYNNRIQKLASGGTFITAWGSSGAGNGQFDHPGGIIVGSSGTVYVTDTNNNRIQKFTSDGAFITSWGSTGTGNGQFNTPYGIGVDASGNVYVADSWNNRIQKFTADGTFITAWGSTGTGNGQFYTPWGIAVDGSGTVYVAEFGSDRIQKFTSDGVFITSWGNSGTGNGQFFGPQGIAVGASGTIYVADQGNNRIQKFTSSGTFITSWGSRGSDNGQFNRPYGIAVETVGTVYVADTWNNRIQKFTSDGTFTTAWESSSTVIGQFNQPYGIAIDISGNTYVADTYNHRIQKFAANGTLITSWGSYGTGDGQFDGPSSIAFDTLGNIYVSDKGNYRIQKFTSDGSFLTAWGSYGAGNGQFDYPYAIALDISGNIYVTDFSNHRIQKFSGTGEFKTEWGSSGTGNGQFDGPSGIAVDTLGNVYVAEFHNNRIQKFSDNGTFITAWGDNGTGNGQFYWPQGVAIDASGNVYVADEANNRIQKFSSEGVFQNTWGAFGTEPGHFNHPIGIALNASGLIYVADTLNNRIQVFKKVEVLDNPKAIIVAGGGPGEWNSLWDATQLNANYAYRALTYQGYTKDSIFYLSADADLDLDGNGVLDDVDRDSTNANLEYAITEWAAEADSVIIYLVDHGGNGTFRMAEDEILTAAQLDGLIDDLQIRMKGRVIVVYDACESGSFQNTLQGAKRTIITSTSVGERAKFLNQGSTSFSFFFWTYIFNGMTLEDAFNAAAQNINFAFDSQTAVATGLEPGLVVGSGADQNFGQVPVIGQVSPHQMLTTETSAAIYASDITCSGGIERVWAVIWRPNYETSPDNPALNLPKIELLYNSAQARYEGVYDNCTTDGTYQVAVYAYAGGLTSLPKQTTIAKNYFLKRRAILVGGTETAGMPWANIEKSLQFACGAAAAQGYADDTELKVYAPRSIPGVTATVSLNTLDNLEYAITQWAAMDTQDLVLYLVGSGTDGVFKLNSTEILTAQLLDSWLDSLQEQIIGKVTVIYDADGSGSFIPLLLPPTGNHRIVISSAGSAAYFSAGGNLSFSSSFWSQIASGATVYSSFTYARKAIAYLSRKRSIAFSCYLDQSPALDDNGNGTGNEDADGAVARKTSIGMGIKFAADPPQVGIAGAQIDVAGILITAGEITATGAIESVWAQVTPLGYCPGSTGSGPAQVVRVEMTEDSGSPGTYEGMYTGTVQACKIAVYARDTDNQTSPPLETKVYQSQGADMYEVDDTPAQASVIVINQGINQHDGTKMGLAQPHNFHFSADEDWVIFYGLAGQSYTVQADNLGMNCQPYIALYGADVAEPLAVENSIIDRKVFLDWPCTEDGVYYVRLSNSAGSAGTGTEYELSVYIPEQPFMGFIVGTIKNAITRAPVSGARVRTNGGATAISAGGDYEIVHQAGIYTMTVQAPGYLSQSLSVRVEEGEISTKYISLTPVITQSTTTVAASTTTIMSGTTTTTAAPSTTTTSISSGGTTTIVSTTTTVSEVTTTTTTGNQCPAQKVLGRDDPKLDNLRLLRDSRLAHNVIGRRIIRIYYTNADSINAAFVRSPALRDVTRRVLEACAFLLGK